MKKYTQEEYDAIERDEYGVKRLPQGDYSQVVFQGNDNKLGDGNMLDDGNKLGNWNELGDWNMLGDGNKLGNCNTLGNLNMLGDDNTLGNCNTLGNLNMLGDGNKLGDGNTLGDCNTLGDWNMLGDDNTLGNCNKLGKSCSFGEFFIHGKNTSFEGGAVKNGTFVKVGRIGSEMRDAYFFIDENGKFFVRAGCWFSDMDKFVERVHQVHGGTRHERQYMAACEYAKAVLPEMLEEVNR